MDARLGARLHHYSRRPALPLLCRPVYRTYTESTPLPTRVLTYADRRL